MSTNKSFSTETSERYSRALFEVSLDSDDIDKVEYDITADKLASMFNKNFQRYSSGVSDEVNAAAPIVN